MITRFAVLLFVVFLPAGAIAQSVTFGDPASLEGVTRTLAEAMEMDLDMLASTPEGEQEVKMLQTERKKYVEEILAFDDGDVTRRKVVFSEAMKEASNPMGRSKKTSPPVVDVSYVISAGPAETPTKLEIVREDGNKVSDEEQKYLLDTFKPKKSMNFGTVFSGRSMSVGETLTLEDAEMQSFMQSVTTDQMEVKEVSLSLSSVTEQDGKEVAVLGLTAKLTQASPVMEMDIGMEGSVHIFVESLWPIKMDINGTIVGAGSHGGTPITADGIVTMTRSASYK